MVPLVHYALYYCQKGFSVIPICPTSKAPLMKFADTAPMSESEIIRFWHRYPTANLALRCTDFLVLDVDVKHDGLRNAEKIVRSDYWIETLSASTPSGGKHYFLKKRHGQGIKQAIGLLGGVDVKAHRNNYVLVYPSVTAKGQYRWDNKLPMATAPQQLYDLIMCKKNDFQTSFAINYELTTKKDNEIFDLIREGLGGVGGRNQGLASLVGKLLNAGISRENIFYFSALANRNTAPPLSEREVKQTIESMVRKHELHQN